MSLMKATLLFLGCVILVSGHNWYTYPLSRANQAQSQTGCRYGGAGKRDEDEFERSDLEDRQTCNGGPCCAGPCDAAARQSGVPVYSGSRGQATYLSWNTHNHPGGFVRIAWAPTASSSAHSNFDAQVDRYVCKETGGCNAQQSDQYYYLGQCNISYTIPTWLSDGAWTLQWAYFGGSNNAGDYYACVDYNIAGGSGVTSQPAHPVFIGGDAGTTGTSQCRFYTTYALHTCTQEPCENGTHYNPSRGMSSFGPYYGTPKIFQNGNLYNLDGTPASSGSGSGTTTTAAAATTTTTTTTTTTAAATTTTAAATTAAATTASATTTTAAAATTTTATATATSTTGPRPVTTNPLFTTGQLYNPGFTTHYSQEYIPETGTTGDLGTKWCYRNGTPPNINGPVNNPPTCGTSAPNARCPDGQCCSSSGICGPVRSADGFYYQDVDGSNQIVSEAYALSIYCANGQADYRRVACTGNQLAIYVTFAIISLVILFVI